MSILPLARIPSSLTAWRRALALWALALLACLLALAPPAAQAQTPVPASVLGEPVQQVVGGGLHTCALTATGAVYCWGRNDNGLLGNGGTTDAITPQPVTGLGSGVAAISGGFEHTCALTTAGAVLCWGYNDVGQLGNGSTTFAITPQPVTGLGSGVAAIAAGSTGFHTCVVTTAGALRCWGLNGSGQLGNGSSANALTPQPVTGLSSGVAAVMVGSSHTCAVTTAGAMQCWGWNNSGQLGSGGTTSASTPQPVTGLGSGVAAMAGGLNQTCALTTAGAVQCWGDNSAYQLGNGSNANASTPQPVTGLGSGVAAIAAGIGHTCALTTAGAIQCWGQNGDGRLGNGSTANASTPQAVTGLATGVASIAAGRDHTCAVTTAGALQCWGSGVRGQLGTGSTSSATTPQSVAVLGSGVKALAAKIYHTCALSNGGAVSCWGFNDHGQLGDNTTTNRSTPQPVTSLTNVAAVTAGVSHTCALTTAGTVQCWGLNAYGQLGDNTTNSKSTPQSVPGLANVTTIVTGGHHTCALITDGTVQCWGYNANGELGDGSTTNKGTPQPVPGLANVAAITAGGSHTCALITDGTARCWGENSVGQLGDGSSFGRRTPQTVTGLVDAAAIQAGSLYTCALTTAGTVRCWGYNFNGQLGDGSTANQGTPQPVVGLTNVVAVAPGTTHTCALTTTGAMRCWGGNAYGQLGDGSTTSASTPQPVTGLGSGVTAIAAGAGQTCALTAAGAVQCWGYNIFGQLGNASSTNRQLPTPIAAGQAIDFVAGTPVTGATSTLAATASSGLAVVYQSFTPDVCTVSGSTLTVLSGKARHWCGVLARQAGGAGTGGAYFAAASAQSRLMLVAAVVPGVPTSVTATAGNAQATVVWTAPTDDGGSALTGYTVTAVQDGTKTCAVTTGSPRPTTCTVTGLANGTAYTFTVKATNAVGNSVPSAASAAATPTAPPSGGAPTVLNVNSAGTTTVTDPGLPIVVGPGAVGAVIGVPGTGSTPVSLQITVNGQPLTVTVLPGTQLRVTQVNGQSVLVLVVLQGWASMVSTSEGQPMALAGEVLLRSGAAGTRIEAQPFAVAVTLGSLLPPSGTLPHLGAKGLQAGERLQVNAQGAVVSIALGSLNGTAQQVGDAMAFVNLPAAITIDAKAFARLDGPVTRLSGANLAQGLEIAPSGVIVLRTDGQVFQLLPTQPIGIDATAPDGAGFTPLGLLRWVRGGVVVQFAPAVADLAGLATAVTAALPGATLKLGAEGVLQLTLGGQTYVLKPDWAGAGMAAGTPQIGVDGQGHIVFQIGNNGPRQLLLPALLNATQASSIFSSAIPGATLAVQPGSSEGALTLTLAGQRWRLVPQWVLPAGDAASQAAPWRMGADGLLYLKLGTQVQGVRMVD